MTRPKYLKLQQNSSWPAIIGDVIGDTPKAETARAVMWFEVIFFVEKLAKLPIRVLADDPEVRRDIAIRVMGKLEARSYKKLRGWHRRQQLKIVDRANWWNFVGMIARYVAVDVARCSRLNVARRGDPFELVKLEPLEPSILNERSAGRSEYTLEALDESGVRRMYEALGDYQEMVGEAVVDEDPSALKTEDPPSGGQRPRKPR